MLPHSDSRGDVRARRDTIHESIFAQVHLRPADAREKEPSAHTLLIRLVLDVLPNGTANGKRTECGSGPALPHTYYVEQRGAPYHKPLPPYERRFTPPNKKHRGTAERERSTAPELHS